MAGLSVFERIERMQPRDADKIPGGDFSVNLKSGMRIPDGAYAPRGRILRVMKNSDDE